MPHPLKLASHITNERETTFEHDMANLAENSGSAKDFVCFTNEDQQ